MQVAARPTNATPEFDTVNKIRETFPHSIHEGVEEILFHLYDQVLRKYCPSIHDV